MNKSVYDELIKIAQKGETLGKITYQELSNNCKLGLDMQDIDQRNQLANILGDISRFEVSQGRPMLSAIVINEQKNEPGKGFYDLAKDLKKIKPSDDKIIFWAKELERVYRQWSK